MNPYSPFRPGDFKSPVSANSTTPAQGCAQDGEAINAPCASGLGRQRFAKQTAKARTGQSIPLGERSKGVWREPSRQVVFIPFVPVMIPIRLSFDNVIEKLENIDDIASKNRIFGDRRLQ